MKTHSTEEVRTLIEDALSEYRDYAWKKGLTQLELSKFRRIFIKMNLKL
jgi:hypothetical protein